MVRAWGPRKICAHTSATGATASIVYNRARHRWSRRGSPSAEAVPSTAAATSSLGDAGERAGTGERGDGQRGEASDLERAVERGAGGAQNVDDLDQPERQPGGGAEHHAAR